MRGKDIKKGTYQYKDLHIIAYFPVKKYNIEDYPAVDNYLQQAKWSNKVPDGFGKLMLEQSGKSHIVEGIKFKSRKFTHNKWFEVQDSISYWDDFNKQKIVYSETNNQKNTKIALDSNSYCTDKTCFILVANNYNIDIEYIYKVLSSSVFSFYMNLISPLLGDSGISLTKESVIKFPLAKQGLKNFNNVFELYSLNDKEKEFIVKYFE